MDLVVGINAYYTVCMSFKEHIKKLGIMYVAEKENKLEIILLKYYKDINIQNWLFVIKK